MNSTANSVLLEKNLGGMSGGIVKGVNQKKEKPQVNQSLGVSWLKQLAETRGVYAKSL